MPFPAFVISAGTNFQTKSRHCRQFCVLFSWTNVKVQHDNSAIPHHLKIPLNMIFPCHLGLPTCLLLSSVLNKMLCGVFIFCYACYMLCKFHPLYSDQAENTTLAFPCTIFFTLLLHSTIYIVILWPETQLTRTKNKQGRRFIHFTLIVFDVGSDTHDSEPKRIKNFLNLSVVNAILMSLR
jgi:hypothetical protein